MALSLHALRPPTSSASLQPRRSPLAGSPVVVGAVQAQAPHASPKVVAKGSPSPRPLQGGARSEVPAGIPSPALLLASLAPLVGAGRAVAEAVEGAADAGGFDWYSPVGLLIQLSPIALYGIYRQFLDPLKSKETSTASHILVDSEEKAEDLKAELAATTGAGESLKTEFARLATANSTCPSAERGGALGTVRPGQMVPEFNQVIFNEALGVVHGPVKTSFGYHLILIDERTDKEGK